MPMPHYHDCSALRGLRIAVTRPAHQAAAFCAMLEAAGAVALRCPVIRIRDPGDISVLTDVVERLDSFDMLVFNSPNAAERGIAFIHARRRIPGHITIGAIGAKTAQAVERFGYRVDVCPASGFDSEAFLELPATHDMRGKQVAILRGQDGRMLLGNTLRTRGAEVVYAQTYQRCGPDQEQTAAIRQALQDGVDAMAVTSSEALAHLLACLDASARTRLQQTTLVVGHTRIAEAARRLGLPTPVVAADPTDDAMFAALCAWAKGRRQAEQRYGRQSSGDAR